MTLRIRPVCEDDIETLVQLGLAAWEPVFQSFEAVLGRGIYTMIWPEWRTSQRQGIEAVCRDGEHKTVGVADVDGVVAGFVAYTLDEQYQVGDVELLAVDPRYQNRGIGTVLNRWALDGMRAAGMKLARVETGGDPGHAPARRTYEKAGYTALPFVRYFQEL